MKPSNYITTLTSLILIAFSGTAVAKPPEPEAGKRWVINNAYSDEFNGNSLDTRKWRDHHRSWKGRPPAMFDPSTVSVKNGNMQIKNKMMETPNEKFSIAGGAVQSLKPTAYHGYYEAKFKASRINMSTTFWLSNDSVPLKGKNHKGEDCKRDKWGMELDIAEAIGGIVDKPWAKSFRTKQQYNTHIWYRGCEKKPIKVGFSRGTNQAEGDGSAAINNTLPNGKEVWEGYNTYAAWWKNENEVNFYLNDQLSGKVTLDTKLLEKPYNRPMQMQMVTETYEWGTPYPTPQELGNDSINTSYYDWVRSYYLVDIDEDAKQELSIKGQPEDIFEESIEIKAAQVVLNQLRFSYLYTSDEDVIAEITLYKNKTKTKIHSTTKTLKAGYGHVKDILTLNTASDFDKTQLRIKLQSTKKNKTVTTSKPFAVK